MGSVGYRYTVLIEGYATVRKDGKQAFPEMH